MYKIETHCHTKPVSACGRIEPEEMIRLYHKENYDTVFISDHFAKHHFEKLGEGLTWDEKTDLLYGAYEKAKAEGKKYGMNVLFSPELSLGCNHYLLYGVDRAFLKLRDDLFDLSIEEFSKHAKANHITVIQAHPLRDGKCVPEPEYVDGMEVVNTNPRHENFDEQVMKIAKEYGFPISAGSDAHRYEDVAGAAMLSPVPITTVEEYLALLKSGKAKIVKNGRIL